MPIFDQELPQDIFLSLFSVLGTREVLPPQQQIKSIADFSTFCEICIYPFVQLQEGKCPQSKEITFWPRAPGLFKQAVTISFLGAACNVGLHHLRDQHLRLSVTQLDAKASSSLFVELTFDESSFEQNFTRVEG
jgi:hypothetical protein